jgi:hypothetical protein
MTVIRWFAATFLLALFLITIVCNLSYVYRWRLHGQRASLILLVGGAAGLLGFLALPVPTLNRWFWLPILADFAYGIGDRSYSWRSTLAGSMRVIRKAGTK